mgnify:CR=1 FL=1
MTRGFVSYEIGKYSILFFLLYGIVVTPKQKFNFSFLFYLLLLIIGIIFTSVPAGESIRKAIVFNLSGPISLGISAIYFYRRKLNVDQILNTLFFISLPIYSMVIYLYFRTPNLKEIVFGGSSLGDTSGGFGPNQVATILGFGIFVIAVFLYLKKKLSGYIIFDAIFLAYFTYRGLLTFSRGGIITGGVIFIAFSFFMIINNRNVVKSLTKYLIISGLFIIGVWLYTSNVTGGMINNRYTNKNASGIEKADITTGRGKIFQTQLDGFKKAPILGIGVGNGKYERQLRGENISVSHNEVSRMLEEHGSLGLIALAIILFIPLNCFLKNNNYQRAFTVAFYIFWFLTINHSAMRVALPGFIYGLSLINVVKNET